MDSYLLDIQLEAFERLSNFLNNTPDAISADLVKRLCHELQCSPKYAYTLLLAAACGLDTTANPQHRDMFHMVFQPAVYLLDIREYQENSYYQSINFPNVSYRSWQLCHKSYKPFEAFVCNDIEVAPNGLQIPQIGIFGDAFDYPAVTENGRIWMSITPNEVETMKQPVNEAFGKVLTFGLGLGYYVFMVAQKSEVENVTVVEKDDSVVALFRNEILTQFPNPEKVTLICADAFEFAEKEMPKNDFDYIFTDLWHDVSDGISMYRRMKELEIGSPRSKFAYWIEKSIKCYM